MYLLHVTNKSRKLTSDPLPVMCTTSGDVGRFSAKYKPQGQLVCQVWHQDIKEVVFSKQIYTMHGTAGIRTFLQT